MCRRRIGSNAELARLPESFGGAIVFFMFVAGRFGKETLGQAHGTQADRPALAEGDGHVPDGNRQPA